jgi:transposase-like protein
MLSDDLENSVTTRSYEEHDLIPTIRKSALKIGTTSSILCPYCNSANNVLKGFRYNNSGPVQLRLCKSCGKRFPEKRATKKGLPDDIAESYLLQETSLEAVLKEKKLGISRSTLFRRIGGLAKDSPSWRELLKAKKEQNNWGFVMGIDTTTLKSRGTNYTYLHVVDVTSKDDLVYELIRRKDAATIKSILMDLRNLGYTPRIVVTDLARELLKCINDVFPNAIVQGCIFHVTLMLEKELPTRKNIKKVDKETRKLWRKVKGIIQDICVSKDRRTKMEYLEQLMHLDLDETAKKVRRKFMKNLKYYHTLDEDEFKDYDKNILYDNVCERRIKAIKDLRDKFKGFKNSNMEATNDIIKQFWFLKSCKRTRNSIPLPKKEENSVSKQEEAFAYYMPLTLLDDCMNIAEFSKASGISREVLNKTVKKLGHIVVGDYAITENKQNAIKNWIKKRVSKSEKISLSAVMRETGFDYTTTMELLIKFKCTFQFNSLDPSETIISSISSE